MLEYQYVTDWSFTRGGSMSSNQVKKEQIIETAIKLFAKNGYYPTSIQEIAQKSGISKGSFYLYFRSKDELMLSILKYYFERLKGLREKWEKADLPPKEIFKKQLKDQFEELYQHKEFIIMQLREQSIPLNDDDINQYLKVMHYETYKWLQTSFLKIYGSDITPFSVDLSFMFQGISHSFLKVLVLDDIKLDFEQLSHYLVDRLDDLVQGLMKKNKDALINYTEYHQIFNELVDSTNQGKKEICDSLMQMKELIEQSDRKMSEKKEHLETINFLLIEMERESPRKIVFQGMLSNLKGLSDLEPYRQRIANRLQIRLM